MKNNMRITCLRQGETKVSPLPPSFPGGTMWRSIYVPNIVKFRKRDSVL
jgi:hypothetical protein